MRDYSLSHLSDGALLRRLTRLVARDRVTTAMLIAHIAEVDARRLYAPAGYSSMHAYCVGELRLSEDAASKRIQAARAARRVPALFTAVAEGRLHLSGICLLAPHLTPDNAEGLIEAATHRRKADIEAMVWRRFGPSHVTALVDAVAGAQHAPGHVASASTLGDAGYSSEHVGDGPTPADETSEHAPGHVVGGSDTAAVPSPTWTSLRLTISASTLEKLRYAQALLSHAVPSGDPAEVLDRALDALIPTLEKRKFGSGASGTRRAKSASAGRTTEGAAEPAPRKRYIPAHVRREVWERDQGRCTFLGTGGHRCEARRFLEFDHVEPVARGGRATVEGIRLRCRTHNQYEAERVFGASFMSEKRRERAPFDSQIRDVQACLRNLGCRADDARRAAEWAAASHGGRLEDHLRAVLQSLGRRSMATPAL